MESSGLGGERRKDFEEWETFANGNKPGSGGDIESKINRRANDGWFHLFFIVFSIILPRLSQPLNGCQRRDEK